MTVGLFIILLTIGALTSSLLTQAIKKAYDNANKSYSANLIALVNSIVIGCGVTAVAYLFLGIEWNLINIVCLILMYACVWIAEMIGYDKVIQTAEQIKELIKGI